MLPGSGSVKAGPVPPVPALEHDLGSEVLLPGGVVTHAHLQHPLRLHHLNVLHVSLSLMEDAACETKGQSASRRHRLWRRLSSVRYDGTR